MRFIKLFLVISILLLAMINTGCGKQPLIDIEKWTNDDDADSAPGPEISVGDSVTWTYMVTNTGSSTLESIQVTDDKGLVPQYLSGDDNQDKIMQVGEKWTYQATGTATEGQYKNIGTVTGKYRSKTVTDRDSAFYLGGAYPSIDIEKTTNGQDADTPTGPEVPVGSDVSWTYTITNSGNVDLINIAVIDDDPSVSPLIFSKGDGDGLLEVGETWTYKAAGKSVQGQYSNTGSVEAWHNTTKVTDADISHYFGTAPAYKIDKTVTETSIGAPGLLHYTVVLSNMGNIDLTGVTLADSLVTNPGSATESISANGVLNVGETWTWQYTYSITQGQIDAGGSVVNIATGDCTQLGPIQDSCSVPVIQGPSYTIDKTVTETSIGAPGLLHYKVVLSNTGNIGLTGVTLNDDKVTNPGTAVESISANGVLNVGETWTWQYTYSVTQVQIDAGTSIVNIATGDCAQLGPIQDSCTVPVIQGPSYTIDKTVTETSIGSLGLLHYKVVLRNTGNIGLTGVTFSDSLVANPGTAVESVSANGVLNVGETWTWQYTYSVTQGQIDAGTNIMNVATGDCAQLGPIQDSCSVPVTQNPGVDLKKLVNDADADSAPGPLVPVDFDVTFKYVVTNTGNITLTNIAVNDNPLGSIGTIPSLAPGSSQTLTKTITAVAGQHTNTGSVTSTQGATDSDLGNYFGTDPKYTIDKTVTETSIGVPGLLHYKVVLSNTGNIDLTGVTLSDSLVTKPGTAVESISTNDVLNVGETWTWQYTYGVTQGQIDAGGSIVNTATWDCAQLGPIQDSCSVSITQGPVIDLEKLVNGADADSAPGPAISTDANVTFSFIVRNTGNVTLTNVAITDNKLGTIGDIASLVIGAQQTFTKVSTAVAGQHANTGSVTSTQGATDSDLGNYFGTDPKYTIDKTVTETSIGAPGLLHYKVALSNTGNIDLTGVTLSDSLVTNPGSATESVSSNGVLNVGETWTWQYTYSVTQGQIDAGGSIVNIATGDCAQLGPIQDSCNVPVIQGPSYTIDKTVTETSISAPGFLHYKVVLSNTGNIGLTGVTLSDSLVTNPGTATESISANGVLNVGETWTWQYTYSVTQGQIDAGGSIVNIATGDCAQLGPTQDSCSVPVTQNPGVDLEKLVNDADADSAPGPLVPVETDVTFKYVVTNTGNVTLTNVAVNDNLLGSMGTIVSLAPGSSQTLTKTVTAVAGQHANTGSVTSMQGATDSDLGNYFGTDPAIDIEKSTNGQDADDPNGQIPELTAGDEVIWTYRVENIGNVDLENVEVTDSEGEQLVKINDGDGDTTLSVSEVWIFQANGTAVPGLYSNIGTAVGYYGAVRTEDSDPSNYYVGIRPVISIRKLTNSIDVITSPGPVILVNDPVTWTYIVRNNGNVDLSSITVSDIKVGTLNLIEKGNNDDVLQVNEEWVYEASGFALEGQYSNTGVAEGWFESTKVNSSDTSYYYGSSPSYTIDKTVTESSIGAPGLLHYRVVLSNTGNIGLTGVTLSDSLVTNPGSANESISANGVLNVGETWTWQYTYNVTQGLIDAGTSIVNTATGDCAQLGPIQDSCSMPVTQNPEVDLEKLVNDADADSAPGPLVPVDFDVTFKYVVTNTGNVTLTNVAVNDNPLGSIGAIPSLAPGASQTLMKTVKAVADQHTNTGSVTTDQGTTDSDLGNYFGTDPKYTIDKTVTEASIGTPGLLHYRVVLRNTGNIDLTGVTFQDSLVTNPGAAVESISANSVLNVGETWTWQYTYSVTQGLIDAGTSIVNTATGDCTQLGPIQDSCSVPVMQNPGVDLEKLVNDAEADSAPGPLVAVDSDVMFKYMVTNIGNVTLTNILVNDNPLGSIGTIESLAPGASQTLMKTVKAVADQHTNTGSVTTDQGVWSTDDGNYFGTAPAYTIEKTVTEVSIGAPGLLHYKVVLRNTGNIDLTGVTLSDNLVTNPGAAVESISANSVLNVGETWTWQYTYSVTQGQIDTGGNIVNTATGYCAQLGPIQDSCSVIIVQAPAYTIDKTVIEASIGAPGLLHYTVVLRNTGNIDLTGVTFEDSLVINPGAAVESISANSVLNVGETWTWQYTYSVTQGQIDAGTSIVNTATGDCAQLGPIQDSCSVPVTQNPEVDLEKLVNDADADSAPGPLVPVDFDVTFKYVVTNTGNITLTNIAVNDNPLGSIGTIPSLAPGSSQTLTKTITAVAGQHTNTGSVTSTQGATDSDLGNYFGTDPKYTIDKTVTETSIGTPGLLHYRVVLRNTGNIDLTGVTFQDSLVTNPGAAVESISANSVLNVGETWTWQYTYSVTQGQIDAGGNIVNTATGDCAQLGPIQDSCSVPVTQKPGVDLEKLVNDAEADSAPGPLVAVDSDVMFKYMVTNTGNVTLTNVAVNDNPLGSIGTIESLAPGASQTLIKTVKAVANQHTNTGSATSTQGATDSDLGNYFGIDPKYTIDKTVTEASIGAPGLLHYKVVLRNTGNIDLTGVTLADSLVTNPSAAIESSSPNSVLNVGETWTWQYTYSVTQGHIDAGGNIVNTATGDCAQLESIQDSCSVPITQNPAVDLEKLVNDTDADSAPGPYLVIGSEVTYKFIVRNMGNTTLTDVVITDNIIGPITTIPSLSVGAEEVISRTARAAAGQHTNIGTVTTSQSAGDTDNANYYGVTDKIWTYDFTAATDIVADGWVVDDGSTSSINSVHSSRNPKNIDEGVASAISIDSGYQLISGQGLYLDYIGVSSPFAFTGDFTMEVVFSLDVDSMNTFNMQLYPGDTQIAWPDNYVYTDFYRMGEVGNERWYVDENHLDNYITVVDQLGTIPGLNRTGDNTWKMIKTGNTYEVWMNGSMICNFTATICAGSKYYVTLYAEPKLSGLLYFKRVTVSFDGQIVNVK